MWRAGYTSRERGPASTSSASCDPATAERVAADYLRLAEELAAQPEDVWLSIDLSHLGLDIDRGRRRTVDGRRGRVRPDVLSELVTRGIPVRVYVPFGADWFRYWMRRVAESRGSS